MRIYGVGLRDHYDPALPDLCDEFVVAGVLRIGRWIKLLRRRQISQAVIVGRVSKARLMHQPMRLFRQRPDWTTARLWYRRLRKDRRTPAVLEAVADEMRESGITIIDSTRYIGDQLAEEGVMTRVATSSDQEQDISKGWSLLRRVVALDIGQSIAICGGKVIAVESLEGTDAMIDRAGRLNGTGWTLLKAPSANHDMRFDVPAIGPMTIEQMVRARAGCLALDAGRVIMIDKAKVIDAAERAGISIVGVIR